MITAITTWERFEGDTEGKGLAVGVAISQLFTLLIAILLSTGVLEIAVDDPFSAADRAALLYGFSGVFTLGDGFFLYAARYHFPKLSLEKTPPLAEPQWIATFYGKRVVVYDAQLLTDELKKIIPANTRVLMCDGVFRRSAVYAWWQDENSMKWTSPEYLVGPRALQDASIRYYGELLS